MFVLAVAPYLQQQDSFSCLSHTAFHSDKSRKSNHTAYMLKCGGFATAKSSYFHQNFVVANIGTTSYSHLAIDSCYGVVLQCSLHLPTR